MVVLKYALMYITAYLVLVGLSALFLNEPSWLPILGVLLASEVFRIFVVHVWAPGFEERMVEKYGGIGGRAAERIRDNVKRRR